jgi:hypothetical protein
MDDVHVNIGDRTPRTEVATPALSVDAWPQLESPEQRFTVLRQAWRTSEGLRIWAAVMLAEADERGDWFALGYDHVEAYAAEIGIPRSTARKLRRIGRVFGRRLLTLPVVEQAELNTERLSIAAQRVDRGQVDVDTALTDAVAHPCHVLLAMRDAETDEPKVRTECPDCGDVHWCTVNEPEAG